MTSLGLRGLGLLACTMLVACSDGNAQGDCRCSVAGTNGVGTPSGGSGSSVLGTGGVGTTGGSSSSTGGVVSTGGVGTTGGSGAGGASETGGVLAGDAAVDGGPQSDRCALTFDAGPCDAAISVYWFNSQTGDCEPKTYGGCMGNDNRFDTLEACRKDCGGGDTTACEVDADCGWGEIDHEILVASDCLCLFGCPYLLLNQTTITRRQQQYSGLCDPNTDGSGQPCPIDDCIQPPMPRCVAGQCTADSTTN